MGVEFGNHNIYSKAHGGLADSLPEGGEVAPHGRQSQPTIDDILGEGFRERFSAFIQKTPTCWLWTGCLDRDGYGMIARRGGRSPIKAHRAMWMLMHGPITSAQHVLHNCPGGDRPACVNEAHLWLGDQAANMADASAKGRLSGNPHGKGRVLSAEMEQELLSIYRQYPHRRLPNGLRNELAARYGVHPVYISILGRRHRIRASVLP